MHTAGATQSIRPARASFITFRSLTWFQHPRICQRFTLAFVRSICGDVALSVSALIAISSQESRPSRVTLSSERAMSIRQFGESPQELQLNCGPSSPADTHRAARDRRAPAAERRISRTWRPRSTSRSSCCSCSGASSRACRCRHEPRVDASRQGCSPRGSRSSPSSRCRSTGAICGSWCARRRTRCARTKRSRRTTTAGSRRCRATPSASRPRSANWYEAARPVPAGGHEVVAGRSPASSRCCCRRCGRSCRAAPTRSWRGRSSAGWQQGNCPLCGGEPDFSRDHAGGRAPADLLALHRRAGGSTSSPARSA